MSNFFDNVHEHSITRESCIEFFLLQKRRSTKVLRFWCPIDEQAYKCNDELLHTRDIQAYISRPFRPIVYNEDMYTPNTWLILWWQNQLQAHMQIYSTNWISIIAEKTEMILVPKHETESSYIESLIFLRPGFQVLVCCTFSYYRLCERRSWCCGNLDTPNHYHAQLLQWQRLTK